ncbi:EAL domain-containing protein [Chlorogloea sp. CCALA 695]|uniref:EAL domain-containing protein n=1 Tax=Chlorogloea sp. CCALA 695 TaxID=2107693 RepID=UPI001304CBA7|nr:EAL domain-containing protein [Chlorogloea sp. CCALA 695]
MIVEDDIIVSEVIKENLLVLGYIVTAIADSGEQALREVTLIRPDLVLMDIFLKGKMDGIQASAKIWDEFEVPVIYLTANSDINKIQQAKNTAPFGYIIKPFDVRELYTTIEIALHRHKLENQLKAREQWLATVLSSLGDGVIATDDKSCITLLNPVAEVLTGWKQKDAFGKNATEIFNIVHEETRIAVDSPIAQALQLGIVVGLPKQTVLINKNSVVIPIDDSAAPILDDRGEITGAVLVFRDITERKQSEKALRESEKRLAWQASHDLLTGLVNRREFEQRVEHLLLSVKTDKEQHSICYIDLDRFKIVNDTCGHAAGDELLRQVANIVTVQVRAADTVARLGGDEFGLLLNNCPTPQALRIANTIRQKLEEFRFIWQDKIFTVSVSVGLVGIDAENDVASILNAADAACYAAKNAGRNRVHIYRSKDNDLVARYGQMQWVSRIHQALENNSFCLYCQPIVSLDATKASQEHYEILLRLQEETGDIILPMAFIPAAERYGLMHLVDRWVIRTLFTHLGQCYQDGYGLEKRDSDSAPGNGLRTFYAVNLSGASINDDEFIDFLHEQFTLHQVPAQAICFEVTETTAIINLNNASKLIREIKSLGCSFALDDFGSGMSSFAYLKNLPVDYLKIDGNFVRGIVEVPTDLALTAAINQIGHVMGLKTIAEFVENDAIKQKLTEIGIDYAQGYGIAKPRPFKLAEASR